MVLGIIAEYNPFHNGHWYHLLNSKEKTKADYTIAVIGGNFTQRGEPSFLDKWTKAEMALKNGVDLVIELPTIYSTSSAENFAEGAIKILNSLKIVDYISFGAETDNIGKLNSIATILHEEPKEYKLSLDSELKKGLSFPKARENALKKYMSSTKNLDQNLDSNDLSFMASSNNILAIEYLKALKKYKSKMIPITIKRKDSGHLNSDYTGSISSATSIRNMLKTNNTKNIKNVLTPTSYGILKDELKAGHYVSDISLFEKTIMYKLRTMSLVEIANLPDVYEGLENSIKKAANSCNSVEDFVNIVRSKRYTETRIRRILLYTLLGITKKDMAISKRTTPYIRVLGFNENGKKLISQISKNNPNLSVITSTKKFIDSKPNRNLKTMLDIDINSTNIYTLGFTNDSWSNLDFSQKVISIK